MGTPMVYAHRGASAQAPENTLEALARAAELGADGVEIDVRRSRDGALLLHHDPSLRDGRLLAAHDRVDLPALPTLDAALDVCRGMAVNIEIKNIAIDPDFDPTCRIADQVVDLLHDRDGADVVVVSSFDLATIDRVKTLDATIVTGFLTLLEPTPLDSVGIAVRHGHDAIHPYHAFVDTELVASARQESVEVNTWTVDEPERIRALADLGVDGIITNVPDVAVEVLGSRRSRRDDEA